MSGCLCLRSDAVVSPELNAVAPKIATSTSNKTDLDGITLTGVSLSFLQRLRAGAVKKRAAAGPPSDTRTACDALGKQLRAPRREGEPLTTGDVCFEIVKPATAARKCAYAELDAAPGESGQATAFVSHAWSYPFDWLISALEEAGLPKKTLFWIDIAVVNQHKHADHGFDWWSSTFRNAVAEIGHTLLVLAPWHAPVTLKRAWYAARLKPPLHCEAAFEFCSPPSGVCGRSTARSSPTPSCTCCCQRPSATRS